MASTTRQIGSAMVWSVLARGGRFVLGLASSVIVVRSLGGHDYGVLSLVRTILMFVLIVASGGLGQAVLKFLPSLRVHGDPAGARRLVRRVLVFYAGAWLIITLACAIWRGVFGRMFRYEDFGTLLAAAVALALFELLFTGLTQVLNASYDTRRLSLAAVASHATYIVGLAVAMPRGAGILGVLAAAAAGNLVACVMVVGRIGPALSFQGGGAGFALGAGRLARYALPFAAIGMLNLIVWRQSETLFLGHFRSAQETGWFDLAYRIPQLVLEFVPGTVWPLVMAGTSEAYARNPESLRTAIDRYYRMLFLLCAPLCVAGIVLGGRIVDVLYGAGMAPAAVPTQVFFAVFTVSFFSTPLSMSLYVMEKTHISLAVYVVLAAVNAGLDWVLIPRYGLAGAMVPVTLVIVATPFVYRVIVGRFVSGVSVPGKFIARCFAGSAAVLLVWPLTPLVNGPVDLLLALLAAGVLAAAGFRLLRVLGPDEVGILRSIPLPMTERILRLLGSR